MKEWTGQVQDISSRDFQTVKLWSFKIEGSERWFRLGQKEPNFSIGDRICFQERNSQVEWGTITPTTAPVSNAPVPPSAEATGSVTSGAPSNDIGERIRYQAARADACRIVVAALHTEHLPHAANIAKGKRLDLLLGYVDQVTEQLLEEETKHVTK